jgi:CspA family cold shock protein
MQHSTVKWFDAKKGYGFINHPDGGDDVFVHYSQIQSDDEFKTLRTGQSVQFEMNDGPKGLHALNVEALDDDGDEAEGAAEPMEEAGMNAPQPPADASAAGAAPDPQTDPPSPGISSPGQGEAPPTEYGSDADLSERSF